MSHASGARAHRDQRVVANCWTFAAGVLGVVALTCALANQAGNAASVHSPPAVTHSSGAVVSAVRGLRPLVPPAIAPLSVPQYLSDYGDPRAPSVAVSGRTGAPACRCPRTEPAEPAAAEPPVEPESAGQPAQEAPASEPAPTTTTETAAPMPTQAEQPTTTEATTTPPETTTTPAPTPTETAPVEEDDALEDWARNPTRWTTVQVTAP